MKTAGDAIQAIPERDHVAYALAQQIHHLNVAAVREIEEFIARRDYSGAHYREDRWREEILEAIVTHRAEHKSATELMLEEARRQLRELLNVIPMGPRILTVTKDAQCLPVDKPEPAAPRKECQFKVGDRVMVDDTGVINPLIGMTIKRIDPYMPGEWIAFFAEGGFWRTSKLSLVMPIEFQNAAGYCVKCSSAHLTSNQRKIDNIRCLCPCHPTTRQDKREIPVTAEELEQFPGVDSIGG